MHSVPDPPLLGQFEQSIQTLQTELSPLLTSVKKCAGLVDQINALTERRDHEQMLVDQLRQSQDRKGVVPAKKRINRLNQEIQKLHKPFGATETEIYQFLDTLKILLATVPMEPPLLRETGATIEKLEIWEQARNRDLRMRASSTDLMAVSKRLNEMLVCVQLQRSANQKEPQRPSDTNAIPFNLKGRRKREPDLATSRERIDLLDQLAMELTVIYQQTKKHTTLNKLKNEFSEYKVWELLTNEEQKKLLDNEFRPKQLARQLVLRKYGLTSVDTLRKDRQKLRRASEQSNS